MTFRNRIVGTGTESPDQLLANPFNFRIHPKHQQDALEGVLDQVGWVQNIIVNRQTGHVIDGHLRVALALSRNEPEVPVLYIDVSEADEKLVLATIDPLSALAVTDGEQLDALLRDVNSDSPAVQQMLAALAEGFTPAGDGDWQSALGGLADGDRAPFQQMTFTLHDDQADVVKQAIDVAKGLGAFVDTGNENSNGNALARVCELFLGQHG